MKSLKEVLDDYEKDLEQAAKKVTDFNKKLSEASTANPSNLDTLFRSRELAESEANLLANRVRQVRALIQEADAREKKATKTKEQNRIAAIVEGYRKNPDTLPKCGEDGFPMQFTEGRPQPIVIGDTWFLDLTCENKKLMHGRHRRRFYPERPDLNAELTKRKKSSLSDGYMVQTF
jgi:hypothetical protein